MKNEPKKLFDIYMELLLSGVGLTEDQLVKFEYLKKMFIKGDNAV